MMRAVRFYTGQILQLAQIEVRGDEERKLEQEEPAS